MYYGSCRIRKPEVDKDLMFRVDSWRNFCENNVSFGLMFFSQDKRFYSPLGAKSGHPLLTSLNVSCREANREIFLGKFCGENMDWCCFYGRFIITLNLFFSATLKAVFEIVFMFNLSIFVPTIGMIHSSKPLKSML